MNDVEKMLAKGKKMFPKEHEKMKDSLMGPNVFILGEDDAGKILEYLESKKEKEDE